MGICCQGHSAPKLIGTYLGLAVKQDDGRTAPAIRGTSGSAVRGGGAWSLGDLQQTRAPGCVCGLCWQLRRPSRERIASSIWSSYGCIAAQENARLNMEEACKGGPEERQLNGRGVQARRVARAWP